MQLRDLMNTPTQPGQQVTEGRQYGANMPPFGWDPFAGMGQGGNQYQYTPLPPQQYQQMYNRPMALTASPGMMYNPQQQYGPQPLPGPYPQSMQPSWNPYPTPGMTNYSPDRESDYLFRMLDQQRQGQR